MLAARKEALRGELLGESVDVLLVDAAAEALREPAGELGRCLLPVGALEQAVHQRAELHHLPVRAADERGPFLVARPVHVAEQLHAGRPVEGGRRGGCTGWRVRLDGRSHAASARSGATSE